MLRRHTLAICAASALLVAIAAGCGGGGGGGSGGDEQAEADTGSDTTEQPETATDQIEDGQDDESDDSEVAANGDDTNTDNAGEEAEEGEEQEGQPIETPEEVGTVVEGRAIATVSGTPDNTDEQSGEVKRVGQECFGTGSVDGLAAGAPINVLDAGSGEVVGSGQISGTSALELSDGSDGNPPEWECSFHISATLTRVPESIQVQVADLAPWPPSSSLDGLQVPVDGSSDTLPPVETTAPPSVSPFDTTPST